MHDPGALRPLHPVRRSRPDLRVHLDPLSGPVRRPRRLRPDHRAGDLPRRDVGGRHGRSAGTRSGSRSRSRATPSSSSSSAASGWSSTTSSSWSTSFAYDVHLSRCWPGTPLLTVAKWSIASALILPQSILLGATFPLMSAGVLRLRRRDAGPVALPPLFRQQPRRRRRRAGGRLLPGESRRAARHAAGRGDAEPRRRAGHLPVVVAAAAARAPVEAPAASPAREASARARSGLEPDRLAARCLLFTSFGTAVASFIYEIDWIRMLALVLGSATHAFELMLSAFILGLALGALWIRSAGSTGSAIRCGPWAWSSGPWACWRSRRCRSTSASFDWIATPAARPSPAPTWATPGSPLARYALCLADHAAGHLLRRHDPAPHHPHAAPQRHGESGDRRGCMPGTRWDRSWAWSLGGLVLLPLLGVKAMLIVGAAVDMAIGVLLYLASTASGAPARGGWRWALGAGAVAASLRDRDAGCRLEQRVLASGVYRSGVVVEPGAWDMLFYRGRPHRDGLRHPGERRPARSRSPPTASRTPRWGAEWFHRLRRRPAAAAAHRRRRHPGPDSAHHPGARAQCPECRGHRLRLGDDVARAAGQPGTEGSRHHRDRAADDRGRPGLLPGEPPRVRRSPLTAGDRRRQVVLRLASTASST